MARISMKELLEAGVHFGHLTRRWNPKMKSYIYGERNGIYIVDLHQTLKGVETACDFIQETVNNGGSVLFVGTKKQAQEAMAQAAEACGMFHVTHRWLGGMLTNFQTIRDSIHKLKTLKELQSSGALDRRPKKEAAGLREEMDKLERVLGGIEDMPGMPSALFIVDLKEERIAVAEARKLRIPIVAVVDTNCDPEDADYVIPGNDDAIRAIKLIATCVSETVIEGCLERDRQVAEGAMRANAVDMVRRHRENVDPRLKGHPGKADVAAEAISEAEQEAAAVAAISESDDVAFVQSHDAQLVDPQDLAPLSIEEPAPIIADAVETAEEVAVEAVVEAAELIEAIEVVAAEAEAEAVIETVIEAKLGEDEAHGEAQA
jgi:small subunit ribosomal protein S2